jgi:acyl-CoA thioester hydrolase
LALRRDDFTLCHRLRVRWAEVDRQDVVFNGNYFLYFDVAIAEYWRAIGFGYPADLVELGMDIFAIKASAEFHGSATYEDELDVVCRVSRIGRSSMTFVFGLWRGAEHLTSGEVVYVNADLKTRKSAPWPESLLSAILAYERVAPERGGATGAAGAGRLSDRSFDFANRGEEKMKSSLVTAASLLRVATPALAQQRKGCAELKADIEAKIKANGVPAYTLEIVPADRVKDGDGQVVGSCDGGTKKIVYKRAERAGPPQARIPSALLARG